MAYRRLNTQEQTELKIKVEDLLDKAEQTRSTSHSEAMKLLVEAAGLIPQLFADDTKGSARNDTNDSSTQEIQYMSKRANIFYAMKEFEKAQACYQFIKGKLPNNTQVYKAIGDCLRKLKKFPEASDVYARALVVYEKDDAAPPSLKAALLNSKGLMYMDQGKHAEAKTDFEEAVKLTAKNPNPLYLCNKAYALYASNQKDEAVKLFEEVNGMVNSDKKYGLTDQNLQYIKKTFEELLKGLKELKTVELPKPDAGIQSRELNFIKSNLNAMNPSEEVEQEEKALGKEAVDVIMAVKLDVKKIQAETKLFEYYDGFLFTVSQLYNTALVTSSGQVAINTNQGAEIDILATVIQLIPIVGSHLSNGLQNLASYAKEVEVNKKAVNITRFATNQAMIDEIVQDVLLELIEAKKDQIRAQDDENLDTFVLPKLTSSYRTMLFKIEKIRNNLDEILYGNRCETPLQKLGYRTANTLVSEYIASGKIYNDELAVRVSKDEKKKRLLKYAMDLFEKNLNKEMLTELEDFKESKGQCESCRMF